MEKRTMAERRAPSWASCLSALRLSLMALVASAFLASAGAQVRMGTIAAHPALWTVRSAAATIYLFGSIHLLPTNLVWHTPAIDRAVDSSDVFVFEIPIDAAAQKEMTDFVRANGMLPSGTTLRALLPPRMLRDYKRALEAADLPLDAFDADRPWLAEIALDVAYLRRLHYMAADGVDRQIFAWASAHNKRIDYFETPEQQLRLFMPKNRKLELEEFDADLKSFRSERQTIGAMVDAWSAGDVKTVGRLTNKDLEQVPGAKALLIDNRNKAWLQKLDAMLAAKTVAFVTVGTGHLVGPKGVPALLRAQGFQVEGP